MCPIQGTELHTRAEEPLCTFEQQGLLVCKGLAVASWEEEKIKSQVEPLSQQRLAVKAQGLDLQPERFPFRLLVVLKCRTKKHQDQDRSDNI